MYKKVKTNKFPYHLMILGLLLCGCSSVDENELSNKNNPTALPIALKSIHLNDLKSNTTIYNKLINPVSGKNKSSAERIIVDSINNFYLDSDKGIYIESGNHRSYTFKINRPNGSNYSLENIVISQKNNGEYQSLIFQYTLTDAEIEMLQNGQLVNLIGKSNKILLENSSIISDMASMYYLGGHCYEDSQTLVQGNVCQEGYHNFSNHANCIYFNNGTYVPTPSVYVTTTTEVGCDNLEGGGNDPSSGLPDGYGGPINTTPVLPELEDPCQGLKKSIKAPVIRGKINTLVSHVESATFEEGFQFNNVNGTSEITFSPPISTSINSVSFPVNTIAFGSGHLHQNGTVDRPSNNYGMADPGDLMALCSYAKRYDYSATGIQPQLFVMIVVQGTVYAVIPNDPLLFRLMAPYLTPEKAAKLNNKIGRLFEKTLIGNEEPKDANSDKLAAVFLKFINNTENVAGRQNFNVSLFKINSDSNSLNNGNWSKVVLDPSKTNGVNHVPCN